VTDITCAVPTLNSDWSLTDTITSIISQKDCKVRLNIVDSGSADNTLEICEKFMLTPAYVPPGNMYQAINYGLKNASTKWLVYTNSDDILYTDSLSRLIHHGDVNGADIVYGVCDWIDTYGRFLYSYNPPPNNVISWFRMGVQPFAQQATIFRRELFEKMNGFDETYKLAADFDFWLRACLSGAKFVHLPGLPVGCFRLHKKQLSYLNSVNHRKEVLQSVSKANLRADLGDRIKFLWGRMSNIGNYCVRILRRRQLIGHYTLPRSMDSL
jgi:glycosyltransferase involved in cell wall biosynthesis